MNGNVGVGGKLVVSTITGIAGTTTPYYSRSAKESGTCLSSLTPGIANGVSGSVCIRTTDVDRAELDSEAAYGSLGRQTPGSTSIVTDYTGVYNGFSPGVSVTLFDLPRVPLKFACLLQVSMELGAQLG